MSSTRLISPGDASALVQVLIENREFLAPWEPVRDDEYFTEAAQSRIIEHAIGACESGTMMPRVILDDTGTLVGRITVNGITRGALQSGAIGYWVSRSHNGRGIATRAIAETKEVAFSELGLHRLQAETVIHNTPSQRASRRNGFTPYGVAPHYLRIAGEWQDHILYQVLNSGWTA